MHGTDGFFAAVFERIDLPKTTSKLPETIPEANIHKASVASKMKHAKVVAEKTEKAKTVKPKTIKDQADKV